MTMLDPFLLGLFREELTAHSAVLTDGLLALERNGGRLSPQSTEPLMRAAHSLKGAARVVDLGEVSRVAHRMEDVFVAMGEGRLEVSPDLVDQLLGALDWMVSIGDVPDGEMETWVTAHAGDADAWASRLAGWLPAETVVELPLQAAGTESPLFLQDKEEDPPESEPQKREIFSQTPRPKVRSVWGRSGGTIPRPASAFRPRTSVRCSPIQRIFYSKPAGWMP